MVSLFVKSSQKQVNGQMIPLIILQLKTLLLYSLVEEEPIMTINVLVNWW